jgi:hypothetical protein
MQHDLDICTSLAADAAERGGRRLCRVRNLHMSNRPGLTRVDVEIWGFLSSLEMVYSIVSITKVMDMPLTTQLRLESPLRPDIREDPVESGMI